MSTAFRPIDGEVPSPNPQTSNLSTPSSADYYEVRLKRPVIPLLWTISSLRSRSFLLFRNPPEQQLGNVDFEKGEVADYDSDEEMKDAPQRVTRAIERKFEVATLPDLPDINNGKLTLHNAIERVGGSEAIALRQRLLALVSQYPLPNKSILISCSSHK